jgi:hypothetical protein
VAAGSDANVQLIDNGTTNAGPFAEYRFLVNLGSISLGAGTYWLALHEGAFGAPFDGTSIFWDSTGSAPNAHCVCDLRFDGAHKFRKNRFLPGALAFQLLDSPAYVPEPSGWALLLSAGGLLLQRRRRR